MPECPFCAIDPKRVLLTSDVAIAFFDSFPVTEGHTLVVPREHVESLYQLSAEDQSALWELASAARSLLTHWYAPDGFNIAVNDGAAAGQTIGHAHIHVIPRRVGDSPDPKGGIRKLFPEKAQYWES
jgi:diadenosine tetraphosphate (Ap4A) HIT family hydrolase